MSNLGGGHAGKGLGQRVGDGQPADVVQDVIGIWFSRFPFFCFSSSVFCSCFCFSFCFCYCFVCVLCVRLIIWGAEEGL